VHVDRRWRVAVREDEADSAWLVVGHHRLAARDADVDVVHAWYSFSVGQANDAVQDPSYEIGIATPLGAARA
jgi:hypothetical protein